MRCINISIVVLLFVVTLPPSRGAASYAHFLARDSARIAAEDLRLQPIQRRCEGDPSGRPRFLRPRTRDILRSPEELAAQPQHVVRVPDHLLREGIVTVPPQTESWTCGVNSAARFAAMLGKPVQDYKAFMDEAPYYGGIVFPKIGGNPEGIQDLLRKQNSLQCFSIAQRCTVTFHPQWEIMIRALEMGRPALVLVMFDSTSMHWINIVARNHVTGNWFYMDTRLDMYEIPGGDDELKHRMNMDNCAAQRFGFVERFNTVTTTESRCTYVPTIAGSPGT